MTRARKTFIALSILAGVAIRGAVLVELTSTEAASHPHASDPEAELRRPPVAQDDRTRPDDRAAAKRPVRSPDSPSQRGAQRNQMRRTLQQKYGHAITERGSDEAVRLEHDPSVVPPASWSSLPEEYVEGILREQLIPVAESCHRDIAPSGTSGTQTLSVAVLGDPEVGGVIDRVDVDHSATSIEGELTECVRQAAYDMQFDPPEEGQGVQEFNFSIEFSD